MWMLKMQWTILSLHRHRCHSLALLRRGSFGILYTAQSVGVRRERGLGPNSWK